MVLLTIAIQTVYCLLGLCKVHVCSFIMVLLFGGSVCNDQLDHLKMVGWFQYRNESMYNYQLLFSGTDNG